MGILYSRYNYLFGFKMCSPKYGLLDALKSFPPVFIAADALFGIGLIFLIASIICFGQAQKLIKGNEVNSSNTLTKHRLSLGFLLFTSKSTFDIINKFAYLFLESI